MRNRLLYVVMAFLIGFTVHVGSTLAAPHVRLNLDTTLFSFNRTVVENDNNSKTNFTSFGMGQSQGWGSDYSPYFGFGIGFLPVDNLSLGMKIGVGGGQYEVEVPDVGGDSMGLDNDWKVTSNMFSYRFLPFIEYKFDLGKVQPFLMATAGYRGSVLWFNENDDAKQRSHLFAYGGGGGLHFFPVDALSIDASLEAMGGVGKTIAEYNDGDTKLERKDDLRDVNLSVNLGLTGWF